MKHIIISGGSYAPAHKGHLNNWITAIDQYLIYLKKKDRTIKLKDILLLVIPVADSYKKSSIKSVTYKQRVKLLNLLLRHAPKYDIKIEHVHKNKILDTYSEIKYIENKYKINPIVLFGADNIIGAIGKSWNLSDSNMKKLFHNHVFICSCSYNKNDARGYCPYLKRKFNKVMKNKNINSQLITFKIRSGQSNISSTNIINNIQNDKYDKLSKMLYQDQISYVKKHKLWK